jgi:hypothetical protein
VDASGTILVLTRLGGTDVRGAVFTINPVTGERALLSDFGNAAQGPAGFDSFGLAVGASSILVVDADFGQDDRGALFTVNPATGERTILSEFGNATQGPIGDNPYRLAVDASDSILVIDVDAGTNLQGALFRVDPLTGTRTLVSDFGVGDNPAGAPVGVAIAVVPAPPITINDLITWFDQAVGSGTLRGTGRRQAARLHLSGMRFALHSVRYVLERGHRGLACALLEGVANRTDENSSPPDFVQGPAAFEFFQAIKSLQGRLGCAR